MMFFIDPLPWVGCRSKYQLRKDFNQNQNFFLEKPIKYWHRQKRQYVICHFLLVMLHIGVGLTWVPYWTSENRRHCQKCFFGLTLDFFQKVDKQCHNNKCDNKSLDTIFKTPRLCRYIDVDCGVDLCVV